MSIKQIVKVLLLLGALALFSAYMHLYFYESTIAYQLSGTLTDKAVQDTSKHFAKPSFQWEMAMGKHTLIMTTGNVPSHRRISSEQPWFYPTHGEAILSESVMSDFFKTGTANRQSFDLIQKHWVAAGSIKEGQFIYIGYDPELLSLPWNKTTFYYAVNNLNYLELKDEELRSFMVASKVNVDSVIYYKDYLRLYYNLGLLLLILSLWRLSRPLKQTLSLHFEAFKAHWRSKDRYTLKQKSEILSCRACFNLLGTITLCILALMAFVQFCLNIAPARSLLPTNWFAISSYKDVIQGLYQNLSLQISGGGNELIFKQFLCLTLLLCFSLFLERCLPKEKY